jgi:VanZ family protein
VRFLVAIAGAVRRTPRTVAVVLLIVWAGVLFYFSDQPPLVPHAHSGVVRSWLMNLRHAPAFGMLALLFLWATSRYQERLAASARRVNWALLAVLLYGMFDERHQYYVEGRDASLCDILTDLAGGWLCASVLFAVEEGAPRGRIVRLFLIGVPACGIAALIATLIPPIWPELTWL